MEKGDSHADQVRSTPKRTHAQVTNAHNKIYSPGQSPCQP